MYYSYPESACQLVCKSRGLDIADIIRSNNGKIHSALTAAGTHREDVELDEPLNASRPSVTTDSSPNLKFSSEIWNGNPVQELLRFIKFESAADLTSQTLLGSLQNLFLSIATQKKKNGVIAPKQFITKLKLENGSKQLILVVFRGTWQQDAHEMFNFLINQISETLKLQYRDTERNLEMFSVTNSEPEPTTWIHTLFEGKLTNETRCTGCETVFS